MLFNVDKCRVMHIGNNNIKAKYEMNGKLLEEVTEVIMQNDLKCSSQCIEAVKTANRVLGMMKKTFSIRDKSIILQLYKSLVSWLDHTWNIVSRHGGPIFEKI